MPSNAVMAWVETLDASVFHPDASRADAAGTLERKSGPRGLGHQMLGQHEFFGEIADAISSTGHVLVVGQPEPLADPGQFVSKRRLRLASDVIGREMLDQRTAFGSAVVFH